MSVGQSQHFVLRLRTSDDLHVRTVPEQLGHAIAENWKIAG